MLWLADLAHVTAAGCAVGFVDVGGSCEACAPGKSSQYSNFTCTGPCPCDPTERLLTDGPGRYDNSETCSWLISASSTITLSFQSFETERGYDYVTIYSCLSATCGGGRRQVASLSGSQAGHLSGSLTYNSTTGFMQVVFTSDGSITGPGFEAEWSSAQTTGQCIDCPIATYSDASGSSSCRQCAEGTFQNTTGGCGV